jgi:hypothetical protein
MTWTEALRVLGVNEDVGFKDVRRAYLKLIKVHKPEQDPEGFQRVRQAFEMVSPVLQARERGGFIALPPGLVVVSSGNTPRSTPQPDAAHEPGARDPDEPAADEPGAHQHDAGSAQDEALALPFDAAQHVARWVQRLHEDDVKGAVPDILRSLAHAVRFPLEAQLPGNLLLQVIGDLAVKGDAIATRQVTDSVRAWLGTLPSIRQAFLGEGALRWVLLDELVRAEPQISPATYQMLAKAITLSGEEATKDLVLRQILNPAQSRQDLFALMKPAPTVAKTFGTLLDPPAANAVTSTSGGSWRVWWRWGGLAVFLGVNAVRFFGSAFTRDQETDRHVPATPPRSAPLLSEPRPPAPGAVDSAKVAEVGQLLSDALTAAGDGYRSEDAVNGLLHGACDKTGQALADLHTHAYPLGADARDGLKVLWAEFEVKCPKMMKRFEP